MRKKVLLTICFTIFTMVLGACGKAENKTPQSTEAEDFDSRCHAVEEKYNIAIVSGKNNTDNNIISYNLCNDEEKLLLAINTIDGVFGKLPDGFLNELRSLGDKEEELSIVLGEDNRDLYFISEDSVNGKVCWFLNLDEKFETLVFQTLYCSMENYMERYEDAPLLNEWLEYNPEGYVYGITKDYSSYLFSEDTEENSYFYNEMGANDIFVDRCQAFLSLVLTDNERLKNAYQYKHLKAKAKYMFDEINRIFESIDENTSWNRF